MSNRKPAASYRPDSIRHAATLEDFDPARVHFIYGVGEPARRLCDYLQGGGIEVVGFVAAQGRESAMPLPMFTLEEVAARRGNGVVAILPAQGVTSFPEALGRCRAAGIADERIVDPQWFYGSHFPESDYWHLRRCFRQACGPGGLAYDIGANRGITVLPLASLAARVVGFEPNPLILPELRRNTGHRDNIEIETLALSDESGELPFYLDEATTGGSSLKAEYGLAYGWQAVTVRVERLDEVCRRRGEVPDFIKIDAEGLDRKIIEGGRETIEQHRPALVFELGISRGDRQAVELLRDLGRLYDMRIYDRDVEALEFFETLEARFAEAPLPDHTNIFCLPK